MRTMPILATITFLVLTGNPMIAHAQQGSPEEQAACSPDAKRLCRKDLGNDGAVLQCMQAQKAKLSQKCKKVFDDHGM